MKKHLPSQITSIVAKPLIFVMLKGSVRSRVVLRCGNEVLLVRGRLGSQKWSLPGGGVKRGETPLNGAVREIREELAIDIEGETLHEFARDRFQKTRMLHIYYVAYEVYVPTQEFTMNKKELLEAAWFPLDDLPSDQSDLTIKILRRYPPLAKH